MNTRAYENELVCSRFNSWFGGEILAEKTKCIIPGSFDPITVGHLNIITRACRLFDEVHVVLLSNVSKNYLLRDSDRVDLVRAALEYTPKAVLPDKVYSGQLLVSVMNCLGIRNVVRGVRSYSDLEYESRMAEVNRHINPFMETVFLQSLPEYSHVSSSVVRELIKYGSYAYRSYLPEHVHELFSKTMERYAKEGIKPPK